VETGHEDKGQFGAAVDDFGSDLDNLPQAGSYRQIFISFTMDFTTQTADALAEILENVVLTHGSSSRLS
jgi:hypothetical protein